MALESTQPVTETSKGKVKLTFAVEQAKKAQKGSIGVALLIL